MLPILPVLRSIALVLLLASLGSLAHAQTALRGHLGVSGFTVVGGESPGDRSSFVFPTAGLVLQRRLPVARQVAVEVGLFYMGKGATSEGQISIDGGPLVDAVTELRLAYLDVPILARADVKLRPGVTVGLVGGVTFEFLLDEGIEVIADGDRRTGIITTDNFNGTSVAGQIGGALGIERYEVSVRYHRSMSDVTSEDADAVFTDLRHSGVIVSLSYRL
ncbi:MAG: outer membrane beta-barrel protein [Bacteroidota bacterium]